MCACRQEMYAFTLACYNAGIERIDLHKKMMAQPPWDTGAHLTSIADERMRTRVYLLTAA